MALLLAGYLGLSLLFTQVLGEREIHTHFAYIPLVLAGLWWGHRGVFVAGLLAASFLGFRLTGLTDYGLFSEIEMVVSFLVVGSFFGAVGERAERGKHALFASRQRYGQLIDKSLTGILVYRDQTVTFANQRLGEMLRCRPDELVGRAVWDLVAPECRPEVMARARERETNGTADLHYETRFLRTDGAPLWVDVASTRMDFEGEVSVLVNVYDVTARRTAVDKERELAELARRQEEQLVHSARLAELGELAAGVAHELNQPLTGIRNYARNAVYMLEHGPVEPQAIEENLRRITSQVDRAAETIRRMQQLSRRSDRKTVRIDLNRSLRESVEFLSTSLRLAGVEVLLDLDEDLPDFWGDRLRIEQVFLNVLNNALHALEPVSDRKLWVSSRLCGDAVVIRLRDSGVGFSPEDRLEIFRPFYSKSSDGKGSGLGLSISQSVVEAHGGHIEAEGAPGAGATFTVSLPVRREGGELAELAGGPSPAEPPAGSLASAP